MSKQTASASSIHADPPPGIVTEPSGIKYFTGSQLGKGGFAICYKAEVCQDERRTGHIVALKIVKSQMPYDKLAQKFVTELQLHSKMHHPNIVEFFRAFAFGPNTYVVLEICEKGSLADVLRRRKFVTMPEIRRFLIQTCGAVKYLHARHIVHRDLKTGNLFLDRDMNVKVGDFGLAAVVVSKNDIGHRRTTMCGTPNYLAPEILEKSGRGHNEKVDLWAIGIIAYTLAVGKAPFHAQQREEIYKRLQTRDYRWPSHNETANEISPDLQDLVGSLLVHEDDRPCPDKIVSHKFFKLEYVPDKLDPACTHKAPVFKIPPKSREALNRGFSSSWFLMCKLSGVGEVTPGRCFPVHGGRKMPSIIRECEREVEAGRYPMIPFPDDVVYEPFPMRPNLFNVSEQSEGQSSNVEDATPLIDMTGNESSQRRILAEVPRRARRSKENSDPSTSAPSADVSGQPNLVRKSSQRAALSVASQRMAAIRRNHFEVPFPASHPTRSISPENPSSEKLLMPEPGNPHAHKPTVTQDVVNDDLSSRLRALSTNIIQPTNPRIGSTEDGILDSIKPRPPAHAEDGRVDGVKARIRAVISSQSRLRSRSRSSSPSSRRTNEPSLPVSSSAPPLSNQKELHVSQAQNGRLSSSSPPSDPLPRPDCPPALLNDHHPTISTHQKPAFASHTPNYFVSTSQSNRSPPIATPNYPSNALSVSNSIPAVPKDPEVPVVQALPEMVKIPHSDSESVLSRINILQKALQLALDTSGIAPRRIVRSPRLPYVSKWIDYSKRDGVGYVLEDGTVGCIQNASPPQPVQFTVVRNGYNRLLEIRRDPKAIETMPLEYFADFGKHGVRSVYIAPHRRKVSCSCWKRFGTFMFQKMLQQQSSANTEPKSKQSDLVVHSETSGEDVMLGGPFVRFYQRLGNVGIWGFQDGTFQFNFPDHTKLVLSPDGRHCNFLCLSHRGTREMLEKGTITAELIQEREMLPMTLQSLLSPAAVHHPQASLAPANIFREKIEFIVTVLNEWSLNGAMGKLSPDSRYLQWTGRQVQDGMNKLDWSTVGASGGDAEKYSMTLPPQAHPASSESTRGSRGPSASVAPAAAAA